MNNLKWSKLYFWTLFQSGKEKGITKGRVISYAAQIAEGMMFLHSKVSYHWAIVANRSLNRNFLPTSKEKYRQNKGVKFSRGQWIGWQSQKLEARFHMVSSLDMILWVSAMTLLFAVTGLSLPRCEVIMRGKGPYVTYSFKFCGDQQGNSRIKFLKTVWSPIGNHLLLTVIISYQVTLKIKSFPNV